MNLKLYSGDIEIGTLTAHDIDWPRTFFHFAPTPAYESVRSVFERTVPTPNSGYDDLDDFEEFEEQCLSLDLRLVDELSHTTTYLDLIFIVGGTEAVVRHGFLRRIDERGLVKWVRHDRPLDEGPED